VAQLADAVVPGGDAGADAAAAAAAATLAANKTGFLGGIANVLESMLEGIDGVLAGAHVPYSYGFSIIVLTLAVKLVTFPLSKKQIESTTAMQALQPRVKDLQARRRAARRTRGSLAKKRHSDRPAAPPRAARLARTRATLTHAPTHRAPAPRRATPTTRSGCRRRRRGCTRRLA
jgi:hypothetical protein